METMRKRLAGGGTDVRGRRKSHYVILPRMWVDQIRLRSGSPPTHVDLELHPHQVVIKPAWDGDKEI